MTPCKRKKPAADQNVVGSFEAIPSRHCVVRLQSKKCNRKITAAAQFVNGRPFYASLSWALALDASEREIGSGKDSFFLTYHNG